MADGAPFPEPTTDRTRPLGNTEPAVRFLTESTWPEATVARRNVNGWYGEFPDPDGRLRDLLRSNDNTAHYQAVDELYVHHLLRQRFSDVRYEEGGVGPDFRLYRDGQCVGGVEVASLFQPDHWSREERRNGRIADGINTRLRPDAGYFVNLVEVQGAGEPSPNQLARFVEARIRELPPPERLELPEGPPWDALPQATFRSRDNRLTIDMRFIPMRPGASARTDPNARIVGSNPIMGGWDTTAERLRDRIAAKSGGRYEIDGIPFLVVVGIHDFLGDDDEEILEALFGGESITVATGQVSRRNDGLLGVDRAYPSGRHRRLSAIGTLRNLKIWHPEDTDVAVLHNPYAATPWPREFFPASRRFLPVEEAEVGMRLDWVPGDQLDTRGGTDPSPG